MEMRGPAFYALGQIIPEFTVGVENWHWNRLLELEFSVKWIMSSIRILIISSRVLDKKRKECCIARLLLIVKIGKSFRLLYCCIYYH